MNMVEGDLASVGVPELFREAARERSTGCLTMTRENAEARIFFKNGLAYQARILGSGMRLGTRLMSAGLIDNAQLESALATQRAEGAKRKLGEVLADEGWVSTGQIRQIVEQQIEDTIFEVMRWDSGPFRFDQGVRSEDDVGVTLDVEELIVEGARRFREWHQIQRRVPTLESVPQLVDGGGGGGDFTPEERAVLARVDGTATIADIAHLCGFTDLEAARTVDSLVSKEALTITLPEGFEVPETDPELEAAFDELERVLREAAEARAREEAAAQEAAAAEEAAAVQEALEKQQAEEAAAAKREAAAMEAEAKERAALEAAQLKEAAATEASARKATATKAAAKEATAAKQAVVVEEPDAPEDTEGPIVIAEEFETSAAQDFADLRMELDDRATGRPKKEEPVEEPEEVVPVDESESEPHEDPVVDPFVDTTALLREFSGFGGGEPEPAPTRRRPSAAEQARDDKNKGRFGKKKR